MIMKNDNNNLSAVSKIPYSEIQIQSMNYKFIKQAQSNGNFCEINLKRLIKKKKTAYRNLNISSIAQGLDLCM